ncbi:MAG: holo-ACP synthase [Phycisphaerales bacterium]|jgi:holo-[acyl-carrier protein] synthase|nr:holo-ACP synthase [Phycisphaerales bacterium]
MPLAHGVDIVEVSRIASMLDAHAERFRERCFTAGEITYCESHPARRAEHYAARFAAKEAALKALGTGWSDGIAWTDVEVARSDTGAPSLVLHALAKSRAHELGLLTWSLSLSHTETHAIASVVAMG